MCRWIWRWSVRPAKAADSLALSYRLGVTEAPVIYSMNGSFALQAPGGLIDQGIGMTLDFGVPLRVRAWLGDCRAH